MGRTLVLFVLVSGGAVACHAGSAPADELTNIPCVDVPISIDGQTSLKCMKGADPKNNQGGISGHVWVANGAIGPVVAVVCLQTSDGHTHFPFASITESVARSCTASNVSKGSTGWGPAREVAGAVTVKFTWPPRECFAWARRGGMGAYELGYKYILKGFFCLARKKELTDDLMKSLMASVKVDL